MVQQLYQLHEVLDGTHNHSLSHVNVGAKNRVEVQRPVDAGYELAEVPQRQVVAHLARVVPAVLVRRGQRYLRT